MVAARKDVKTVKPPVDLDDLVNDAKDEDADTRYSRFLARGRSWNTAEIVSALLLAADLDEAAQRLAHMAPTRVVLRRVHEALKESPNPALLDVLETHAHGRGMRRLDSTRGVIGKTCPVVGDTRLYTVFLSKRGRGSRKLYVNLPVNSLDVKQGDRVVATFSAGAITLARDED